jgi:hypothetical protein
MASFFRNNRKYGRRRPRRVPPWLKAAPVVRTKQHRQPRQQQPGPDTTEINRTRAILHGSGRHGTAKHGGKRRPSTTNTDTIYNRCVHRHYYYNTHRNEQPKRRRRRRGEGCRHRREDGGHGEIERRAANLEEPSLNLMFNYDQACRVARLANALLNMDDTLFVSSVTLFWTFGPHVLAHDFVRLTDNCRETVLPHARILSVSIAPTDVTLHLKWKNFTINTHAAKACVLITTANNQANRPLPALSGPHRTPKNNLPRQLSNLSQLKRPLISHNFQKGTQCLKQPNPHTNQPYCTNGPQPTGNHAKHTSHRYNNTGDRPENHPANLSLQSFTKRHVSPLTLSIPHSYPSHGPSSREKGNRSNNNPRNYPSHGPSLREKGNRLRYNPRKTTATNPSPPTANLDPPKPSHPNQHDDKTDTSKTGTMIPTAATTSNTQLISQRLPRIPTMNHRTKPGRHVWPDRFEKAKTRMLSNLILGGL